MGYLVTQGSKVDYNYKEYFCDSATDIATINVAACCPGSVVYTIDTGDVYMLNNAKEWKIQ